MQVQLIPVISPFPAHKCGLYLEHNTYRDSYLTIEEAVVEIDSGEFWVSPEERAKALETKEIWTLHWYPDTPVGFIEVAASTLEAVLDAAKGMEKK